MLLRDDLSMIPSKNDFFIRAHCQDAWAINRLILSCMSFIVSFVSQSVGIFESRLLAWYTIASDSARVILACGRYVLFERETNPISAAISTALHTQSLLTTSEKYFLQIYHSGSSTPLNLSAIHTASARVIVSSRR